MAVVATPQMLPFCLFAYPENDEQTLVNFQNYSRSQYERYVNESSYGGAGVGANENWMVVVFVENTTSWTSAGGAKHSLVSEVHEVHELEVNGEELDPR
ncbi:hypothetical protein D5086_024130 [Populus alba]|uniref:Uncharacterized protein n=1 Tax=Populus alba TaxID=43335 RepID=A0ACC4B649_POPAL